MLGTLLHRLEGGGFRLRLKAALAHVQERLQAGDLRLSIARELRKQLAVIAQEIAELGKQG